MTRRPRLRTLLALLIALALAALTRNGPPRAAAQSQGETGAATAAALSIFNGVPEADCTTNNPQSLSCVSLSSSSETIGRGIADFGIGAPAGIGGFHGILGRTPGGVWSLWFTSQNPYQLTNLPGNMTVCADGDGVTVRAGPSQAAAALDVLKDGAGVTGEQFVLTDPGGVPGPLSPGYGWFRISAPEAGWIYSMFLESAALYALDRCFTRNAQVNGR